MVAILDLSLSLSLSLGQGPSAAWTNRATGPVLFPGQSRTLPRSWCPTQFRIRARGRGRARAHADRGYSLELCPSPGHTGTRFQLQTQAWAGTTPPGARVLALYPFTPDIFARAIQGTPGLAWPGLAWPGHAVPCHAVPCRAVPCRAVPCRAVPGSLHPFLAQTAPLHGFGHPPRHGVFVCKDG